ncbi:hypothetical protein ADL12_39765 [Streptomyces regalis]|uniref:Uncharacterized protein n=1 Tax=Streptomyces regalis TaxID=68262 RepID=A0A101JAJ1_9ACTN|nr:hypothetical protein [Streptomyces regalis]KUL23219.1 hypothetical protein ADL12_39765 [Streptomyces regalis]
MPDGVRDHLAGQQLQVAYELLVHDQADPPSTLDNAFPCRPHFAEGGRNLERIGQFFERMVRHG